MWAAWVMLAIAAAQALSGAVQVGSLYALDPGYGPSDKSRILANGIAEALFNVAFGVTIASIVGVALLLATWRWHWAVGERAPKGNPPYR